MGTFVHGKWFCGESCADKDPEVQKIKELYEKGIDFENDGNGDEDDDNYAANEDIDLWIMLTLKGWLIVNSLIYCLSEYVHF